MHFHSEFEEGANEHKGSPAPVIRTGKDLLHHTKICDILRSQGTLVSVHSSHTAQEAFKLMIDHKILSVPVFDKSRGRYTCFVDILDILVHVLGAFPKDKPATEVKDISEYLQCPVTALADASNRNPFKPVDMNAPVIVALELIQKWGVHRIPIVELEKLQAILSQSTIVPWLYKHLALFPVKDKTVGELKLGYKAKVIAARESQLAGQAMVTMRDHGVSGLAVVDDHNRLVGNISASDLKLIGFDGSDLKKLFLTVGEFINKAEPIHVNPQTTVGEVVKLFNNTKVHRVYVTHGDRQILGVTTLSELLDCILTSVQ